MSSVVNFRFGIHSIHFMHIRRVDIVIGCPKRISKSRPRLKKKIRNAGAMRGEVTSQVESRLSGIIPMAYSNSNSRREDRRAKAAVEAEVEAQADRGKKVWGKAKVSRWSAFELYFIGTKRKEGKGKMEKRQEKDANKAQRRKRKAEIIKIKTQGHVPTTAQAPANAKTRAQNPNPKPRNPSKPIKKKHPPNLLNATSDAFTASESSMGSSGGTTLVMMRMQSRRSLDFLRLRSMPGLCCIGCGKGGGEGGKERLCQFGLFHFNSVKCEGERRKLASSVDGGRAKGTKTKSKTYL